MSTITIRTSDNQTFAVSNDNFYNQFCRNSQNLHNSYRHSYYVDLEKQASMKEAARGRTINRLREIRQAKRERLEAEAEARRAEETETERIEEAEVEQIEETETEQIEEAEAERIEEVEADQADSGLDISFDDVDFPPRPESCPPYIPHSSSPSPSSSRPSASSSSSSSSSSRSSSPPPTSSRSFSPPPTSSRSRSSSRSFSPPPTSSRSRSSSCPPDFAPPNLSSQTPGSWYLLSPSSSLSDSPPRPPTPLQTAFQEYWTTLSASSIHQHMPPSMREDLSILGRLLYDGTALEISQILGPERGARFCEAQNRYWENETEEKHIGMLMQWAELFGMMGEVKMYAEEWFYISQGFWYGGRGGLDSPPVVVG